MTAEDGTYKEYSAELLKNRILGGQLKQSFVSMSAEASLTIEMSVSSVIITVGLSFSGTKILFFPITTAYFEHY